MNHIGSIRTIIYKYLSAPTITCGEGFIVLTEVTTAFVTRTASQVISFALKTSFNSKLNNSAYIFRYTRKIRAQ